MRKFFMLAALAALVISCGSNQTAQEVNAEEITEVNATPMEEVSTKPIEEIGGTWYAAKLGDMEITPIDSQVYVILDVEEMRLSAYAGCNQIGGAISQVNRSIGSFSVEEAYSTKMACEDDSYENALIDVVNNVRRYEFHGESLVFLNEDAETIAEFVK